MQGSFLYTCIFLNICIWSQDIVKNIKYVYIVCIYKYHTTSLNTLEDSLNDNVIYL